MNNYIVSFKSIFSVLFLSILICIIGTILFYFGLYLATFCSYKIFKWFILLSMVIINSIIISFIIICFNKFISKDKIIILGILSTILIIISLYHALLFMSDFLNRGMLLDGYITDEQAADFGTFILFLELILFYPIFTFIIVNIIIKKKKKCHNCT